MRKYCCISGVWEACLETAGDDIGESVTQDDVGDYIGSEKISLTWSDFSAVNQYPVTTIQMYENLW